MSAAIGRIGWQLGVAATLVLTVAHRAGAQLREVRESGTAGLGFMVARPVGDFQGFVGTRGGFAAEATAGMPIGLRVAGSALFYNHRYDLGPGTGRVETHSLIASLGLGPQLTISAGPLKLYGYGTIGGGYFTTWFGGDCGCGSYGSSSTLDDFTLAREVGGGVQLRLSDSRSPVYLHVAGRYMTHDAARHVPQDGVTAGSSGSVIVETVETRVQLAVVQVGVSIGLK
ncbi:MAG: hypothetical protein ACREMR_12435 [Gemmatimonadales bacterium]